MAVGVKVAVDPLYVTTPTTGVTPGPASVKVVPVMVAGFITVLKVAETVVLTATAVAFFAGTVEITIGVPVVKLQVKLAANGVPVGSVAPVVIVPTNRVLAAKGADGVNVAVAPESVTVPATAVLPGPFNVNVVVLIVPDAINELNVAVTVVLRTTPTAPFAGVTEMTVGGAVLSACSRPHPDIKRAGKIAISNIRVAVRIRM